MCENDTVLFTLDIRQDGNIHVNGSANVGGGNASRNTNRNWNLFTVYMDAHYGNWELWRGRTRLNGGSFAGGEITGVRFRSPGGNFMLLDDVMIMPLTVEGIQAWITWLENGAEVEVLGYDGEVSAVSVFGAAFDGEETITLIEREEIELPAGGRVMLDGGEINRVFIWDDNMNPLFRRFERNR